MIDPLTINIVTTDLPEIPDLITPRGILTAEQCHMWLSVQSSLIGWTYSCNPLALRLYKFTKLICGVPYNWFPDHVRYACNTHIKCYIGPKAMLIGSYNLTAPTIQDCAVIVTDKKSIAAMKTQFSLHWKALK